MKSFFLATLLALLALTAIAWKIAPRPDPTGRTPLIWCSDDNPLRRAQIVPFNRLHPDFNLQLDPGNAGIEKVLVQSLAGVGPDLFDCYSPFEAAAYVQSGVAWDITDELPKLGIDVKSETWSAVHPDCIFDGRIFGHPTNAAANGIWFHKDLLARAGAGARVKIPTGPWTWDELIPIAQSLTLRDASNRVTQYGLLIDWVPNYMQFIVQWGGRMYTPDGTRCVIDSPEAIAAMQFMQDLIYKHHICPSPAEEEAMSAAGGWGGGNGSSITFFGAKVGAMAMGGRWWLCRLRDKEFASLQLGAAESPHGRHRLFVGYGKATMINANSPRRREALAFLQYLHSEPYNHLINHQADGVGPVKKYVDSPDFLHDPEFPGEDYNAVWRDMMKAAIPDQTSPFVNGAVARRHIVKQLDLIRANQKPVAAALHDAARAVNDTIEENLRLDPSLRRRYEKLTK